MSNYKKMKGVKGVLMGTADGLVFRTFDAHGNLKDYEIFHCDLEITIEDSDCYLYEDKYLDYSKETLGR